MMKEMIEALFSRFYRTSALLDTLVIVIFSLLAVGLEALARDSKAR
jgi:hypothetical protein